MAWTVKIVLGKDGHYKATGTRTVGEDVTSYSHAGIIDQMQAKLQQAVGIRDILWAQHSEVVEKAAADALKLGTIEADIAAALDAKEK